MATTKISRISNEQIAALEKNGCSSGSWSTVSVADGFDPRLVAQTVFQGEVALGDLRGSLTLDDGIARPAGIYRAKLQNVRVGDGCSISNVNGWLSNLDIGPGVVIENVGTVACVGESTFGNGHEVSVLVEGGGRELKITRETNAQTAYLTVLYRDRKALVERLNAMADRVAATMKSRRMTIGEGALLCNCSEIINVCIGSCARICGAQSLREGTIVSSKEAPVTVGSGVVAEHFIIQQGASVKDGAMIAASLVGEGVKIGKQFSSENSVFFANCEGFHSEVCSIFAGPYTVTHHRSTLLIGGMFSFYNAGSGTNQSNHLYKLGPLHQGIMERGSKTGSSSYLLWPSRIGAFTAVIGKHYAHFDATDFPFSYINEEDGKTTIVPGMNFFTVGTLRDGEKWPSRDRRTAAKKQDFTIFPVLSPYTVQKMLNGQAILMDIYGKSSRDQQLVTWKGITMKRLLLKTCSRYYKIAVEKYFGDCLLQRIGKTTAASLRSTLKPAAGAADGTSEWVDVGGLLCAKTRLNGLIEAVASGTVTTQEALWVEFEKIFNSYRDDEWGWVVANYRKVYGEDLPLASKENLVALLERWRDASLKLLNMVLGDVQKEFEGDVRCGFGIDGNRDEDFEAVRGSFEKNKFVKKLQSDSEAIKGTFESTKTLISSMEV